MAVRKFKPVTPGQRNKVISAFDEITTNKPQKSLLEPLKSTGGRNNTGQMTVRYIGGGHKKMYNVVVADVNTVAVHSSLSRRKSMMRYIFLWPPPR